MRINDVNRLADYVCLWRADDPTRRAFFDFDCLVRRSVSTADARLLSDRDGSYGKVANGNCGKVNGCRYVRS